MVGAGPRVLFVCAARQSEQTEALQLRASRPRSACLLRGTAAALRDRCCPRADMRLATTANEAYTASLTVSELLCCKQCGGSRGQEEVSG